jgi:vacuolar-type H+-ATPase subunit D/Vma8
MLLEKQRAQLGERTLALLRQAPDVLREYAEESIGGYESYFKAQAAADQLAAGVYAARPLEHSTEIEAALEDFQEAAGPESAALVSAVRSLVAKFRLEAG